MIDYLRVTLVINRVANLFVRLLFGVRYTNVTNAFKAYRATVIGGCQPFLSPHFNLTVEVPLKAIVRGYSMGSRSLFIVLYLWLERTLTRGDYRRPAGEIFTPWPQAGEGKSLK